ncbi:MarR family transcriptional regulator [Streptomyces sp. P6-2-1]|uniref:MarR family transcriptional regulator n=1 Tax=Streptomyces sp. P6-2-1 TaxID=3422591 RepID=UPI003D36B30B
MTPAPAADSRGLALAHYAARGVLEHFLTRHGVTFQQQIVLRTAATAGSPHTPDTLVAEVRGYLKTGPATLRADLDALLARELLVRDGAHLRPTEAGSALLAASAAEVAPATARIWADIPAEDLAVAGRVLTRIAERANAELATLTA